MDDLAGATRYLFVFAHPDDELYACALMRRLATQGKGVSVVYVTSGDVGGQGEAREEEAFHSLETIGVPVDRVTLLRIPEVSLLNDLSSVIELLDHFASEQQIDCVVSHDYEGGHEGHDAVSFCASELVRIAQISHHWVFPVYHGKPTERRGARFKPGRTDIVEVALDGSEQQLKREVLAAHASQQAHFDGLRRSDAQYEKLLLSREVYWQVQEPIDYLQRPMEEVGYEFHRNGYTFRDLQGALVTYRKSTENV